MTLKKFETSFFFNEMRTKTIFDKQNANESQKQRQFGPLIKER